jgi:hypothetical protein
MTWQMYCSRRRGERDKPGRQVEIRLKKSILKAIFSTGTMAQWQSTCLVCTRLWVQSSAAPSKTNQKTILSGEQWKFLRRGVIRMSLSFKKLIIGTEWRMNWHGNRRLSWSNWEAITQYQKGLFFGVQVTYRMAWWLARGWNVLCG